MFLGDEENYYPQAGLTDNFQSRVIVEAFLEPERVISEVIKKKKIHSILA
jgi:hypothetical protein